MAKKKSYWQEQFKNLVTDDMAPYWHHFDLRSVTNLNDEGLAYVLSRVKGIYMLDLNETEITDEGIKVLPQLEYINELRLKGLRGVTDAGMEDLNRIKGLTFLHLKNTSVTIDGLLKLDALTGLTILMFSDDGKEDIKAKMLQLKAMLPGCKFVINSKPYYFDEPGWTV